MKELFVGLALVYLRVNVDLGGHTFDVLPDFVGYYLLARGFDALASESRRFAKARSLARGMVVYSAVLYAVEAMAVTVQFRFAGFCLGIPALIARVLIGYWAVSGIRELEQLRNRSMEGEKLHSMWLYAAVIQVITYLCGWIPLVGDVGAVAALVMSVCFLAAFYRTMDLYEGKN